MFLDNKLSYNSKVVIAIIFSGIWIYFRTNSCYQMIPRENLFSVFYVMTWTYLNYYEPLFLPIGLVILLLYSNALKKIYKVFNFLQNI